MTVEKKVKILQASIADMRYAMADAIDYLSDVISANRGHERGQPTREMNLKSYLEHTLNNSSGQEEQ